MRGRRQHERARSAAGLPQVLAVVAITATAALPGWAADRGLQVTPDGNHVLVNKDVGSDRWTIALNDVDGTATGNVFREGGGPPAFISCDPLPEENTYACFGADPCSEGGTQRGIQITPNGMRILVNKDVGAERWAITLNNDDGTATGNVFREDGGDPAFIACNPLATPNGFACFGAGVCTAHPCADAFSFIDNVTLPASFFDVPAPCAEQFAFLANVALPSDFFRLTGVDDFVADVDPDTGTEPMLRIGVAPIPGADPPSPVSGVEGDTDVNPGGTNDVSVTLDGAASATADGLARPTQVQGLSLILAVAEGTCSPGRFVSNFYEIPLLSASGQVSLGLTFSEEIRDADFVLCITTIDGGVVGQYSGLQQNPSACGNDVLEPGEACDPPAAQSQCPTGLLCTNNCLQCVPPTGAPTISGLTQTLVELNSSLCPWPSGPNGSLFRAEFDYSDADGDVTADGSAVVVAFVYSPSGTTHGFTDTTINLVGGDPSAGTIEVRQCHRFEADTSVNVTYTLRDAAGNVSNMLSADSTRPQGAN